MLTNHHWHALQSISQPQAAATIEELDSSTDDQDDNNDSQADQDENVRRPSW
jgi:hypothetical protein